MFEGDTDYPNCYAGSFTLSMEKHFQGDGKRLLTPGADEALRILIMCVKEM